MASESNSRIVTIAVGVVGLALLVAAAYAFTQRRARNLALADAGNRAHKIIQAAEEGKISDKDRDTAMESAIRSNLSDVVDGYFKLPEGKARQDHLDKVIDEQMEMQKKVGPIKVDHSTTQPDSGSQWTSKVTTDKDGGKEMQVTVRRKSDGTDLPPELRARVAEYAAALAKRRADRGLPPQAGTIIITQTSKSP